MRDNGVIFLMFWFAVLTIAFVFTVIAAAEGALLAGVATTVAIAWVFAVLIPAIVVVLTSEE